MNLSDFWTSPSLGPFAGAITGPLRTVISVLWALLIVFAAVKLMTGIGALARAKKNHRNEDMEQEKSALIFPAVSMIALLAFPAIVAAIGAV